MRLFSKAPDGGPDSPVQAYFLCEFKGFFSIALLKFHKGGREAFHSHAFHALTWFLKGDMIEETLEGSSNRYRKSLFPKFTSKDNMHRVLANKDSWCFTIRGPWQNTWSEYDKSTNTVTVLTNGRTIVVQHQATASNRLNNKQTIKVSGNNNRVVQR